MQQDRKPSSIEAAAAACLFNESYQKNRLDREKERKDKETADQKARDAKAGLRKSLGVKTEEATELDEAKFVMPEKLQAILDDIADQVSTANDIDRQIDRLHKDEQIVLTRINKLEDKFHQVKNKFSSAVLSDKDHDKIDDVLLKVLNSKK